MTQEKMYYYNQKKYSVVPVNKGAETVYVVMRVDPDGNHATLGEEVRSLSDAETLIRSDN